MSTCCWFFVLPSRKESAPVSMTIPLNMWRSTLAAQRCGSANAFVPPVNGLPDAMAVERAVARVLIVAGLMLGFSSYSKSSNHLSLGKFAVFAHRMEERRSLSSHSASSSPAMNPWQESCSFPAAARASLNTELVVDSRNRRRAWSTAAVAACSVRPRHRRSVCETMPGALGLIKSGS